MNQLEESFHVLRVNLATSPVAPSVIAVSSALDLDNTSYVATGLARAYAESGSLTLFLDGTRRSGGPSGAISTYDEAPNLHVIDLPLAVAGKQRSSQLKDLLAAYREQYDVVIIDAGTLPSSSGALEIVHYSDMVVLALRLGRKTDAADKVLMTLLGAERGDKIAGVVPTRPGARPHLQGANIQRGPLRAPAAAFPRLSTQGVEVGL